MRVGQKAADVKAPMLQPRASPSGCAEGVNIALGDKPLLPLSAVRSGASSLAKLNEKLISIELLKSRGTRR
jgi:hypothetical protein